MNGLCIYVTILKASEMISEVLENYSHRISHYRREFQLSLEIHRLPSQTLSLVFKFGRCSDYGLES